MKKKNSKEGTYIIDVTEYKGGNKLTIKEKEKASEKVKWWLMMAFVLKEQIG